MSISLSRLLLLFTTLLALCIPAFGETEAEILADYNRVLAIPATMQGFTYAERQRLFRDVSHNPVSDLNHSAEYDPTGEIGFCFGRAMAVQLLARSRGLASENVKKLFVVGDLRQGDKPEWRFHVTSVVKGADGKWYAIDPIMTPPLGKGAMPAEKWIEIVQNTWDKPREGKKHEAKFYLVDNDVIVPEIRDANSPIMQFETFSPETNHDFTQTAIGGRKVFTVDPAATEKYFVKANGSAEKKFRFSDITIGGRLFDYRGYFAKLVDTMLNPTRQLATAAPRRRCRRGYGAV